MNRQVTTRIDRERCIGCGSCVEVCPSDTLELIGERAQVTGKESLNCGHCEAVCPAGAVTVLALDAEATTYATFKTRREWLAPGRYDTSALVQLMASRRSCRNFRPAAVERDSLVDLVKVGATAPSGTNSQRWRFTILPDREAVAAFGEQLGRFFRLLNRVSEQRLARTLTRLAGYRELDRYYREHHDKVAEALDEHARGGRDRLFHGAPAAIIVSSLVGASCPAEDCLLATQNMLLAAHAMGLGTCLIGFAVAAIRTDPRLRRWLDLARGEEVHAVVAVGHPAEVYERTAGRLPIPLRFLER